MIHCHLWYENNHRYNHLLPSNDSTNSIPHENDKMLLNRSCNFDCRHTVNKSQAPQQVRPLLPPHLGSTDYFSDNAILSSSYTLNLAHRRKTHHYCRSHNAHSMYQNVHLVSTSKTVLHLTRHVH